VVSVKGSLLTCRHGTPSQNSRLTCYQRGFLANFRVKKSFKPAHTAELAVGFGRKVRNLVDSANYKRIFPALDLQSDSKAAGRWNTNFGGEYFAIGIGGAVTGKGADILNNR
jgi:hypothetical protein